MIQAQRLSATARLPFRAYEGDAAFDLFSDEDVYLEEGQRASVSTGIALAIPDCYCGLIVGRSGLARDHGIGILGGLIDSGYRGEIGVMLVNHGDRAFYAPAGSRIAQLLVLPIARLSGLVPWTIDEVESLDETVRGANGFGSTGKD